MSIRIIRGSMLIVLLISLFGAQHAFAQDEDNTFRVALTGKYPPFSFYDENGELAGFDVDTSKAVAEKLGRPLEIIPTEWSGIIAGLQTGRYDAIIGSMADTPERRKAVLFSEPYYISGGQLFVREEDRDRLGSLDDFEPGDTIGAGTGSTYEQFVTDNHPDLNMRVYPGEVELFQEVKTGQLNGFVTDRLVGMYNAKRTGSPVVPVGDLLYKERCCIPVRLSDTELHTQINAALEEMRSDGTLEELQIKWFGKSISELDAEHGEVAEFTGTEMSSRVIAGMLWRGFQITLFIAFVSIGIGFCLAIPIGVGINSGPKPVKFVLVAFSDLIRGTPLLVQLFFVYYGMNSLDVIDLKPIPAGIFTLTINTAAYMGEVVRAGLMSVPKGQMTGALALGLTPIQAFRHIIWPQAFRIMVPPLMNSVVALMKDTALVSVIAVPEVINQATIISARTFQPMQMWLVVGVMFFVVSYPLMKLAQRLEDRMRRKGFEGEN